MQLAISRHTTALHILHYIP